MVEEKFERGRNKRKNNIKKFNKNKKLKGFDSDEKFKVKKMDRKKKKFFQKKVRDYNSDNDDDEAGADELGVVKKDERDDGLAEFSGTEEEEAVEEGDEGEEEEDEEGEIQPGVMRFAEGVKAFRLAFKKITKRSGSADDDILGPVLSAHKKLVADKLAEEEAEFKAKGVAKKEKRQVGERGHVKPANYLDSHEKFLIGVATRGVVKLFNAVNKAQHAQKGLNPSRFKDEKAIKKRRKEAFFSELGKKSHQPTGITAKAGASTATGDGDGPAWAPLRDNYMLTNSKLKDWDKMPDTTIPDDFGKTTGIDTSSDDD